MCTELHFSFSVGCRQNPLNPLLTAIYSKSPYWFAGCNSMVACGSRQLTGCYLTTLFGTVAQTQELADSAATPRKHGWLPLLVVLFLISYGLMTMLIVEQGRTIESQRALIHELFRDNTQLNAVRTKGAATPDPVAQNPQAPQIPSTQTLSNPRSNEIPSTQAPTKQTPSSQAGPQHRMQNQTTRPKADFEMPAKPASDLADSRRNLITL